jgi:AcrR family transcriptional regulator
MRIVDKISFKEQTFRLREDAILDAAHRLLAQKGFDLMTMDEVAADVGIAKPSLYKHFVSKEQLVGAAMIRLIDGALDFIDQIPATASPLVKMKSILAWALRARLSGGLPYIPATSPLMREMFLKNIRYVSKLLKLNSLVAAMVKNARHIGELRSDLPDDVILFSFYARSCDPAVDFLRLYSKLDNEAIIAHMISSCFDRLTQPIAMGGKDDPRLSVAGDARAARDASCPRAPAGHP